MHLLRQHLLDAALPFQVSGIDVHAPVSIVGGAKERQPVDVIPVGVAEQQVDVAHIRLQHFLAQRSDTRARVENEPPVAEDDFDATGVPAVANVLR